MPKKPKSYWERIAAGQISQSDAIQEAYEKGDLDDYVCLHPKGSRVTALRNILGDGIYELCDIAEEFWPLVGFHWGDSETSHKDERARRYWREIWDEAFDENGNRTPFSETVMDEAETAVFSALPDEITVWRGYSGAPEGLSWTLSETVAEWFASRTGGAPMVAQGAVRKSEVISFLNGRFEAEIVARPDRVSIFTTSASNVPPIEARRRPTCRVEIVNGQVEITTAYPDYTEAPPPSIEGEADAFLDEEAA
jgi:hypothetical protein